jgi:hypothetical protein
LIYQLFSDLNKKAYPKVPEFFADLYYSGIKKPDPAADLSVLQVIRAGSHKACSPEGVPDLDRIPEGMN